VETNLLCRLQDKLKKAGRLPARIAIATPTFLITTSFLLASISFAQEVTFQKRIGDWSVYCIKGASPPGPRDCSVVTSVMGEDAANEWLKLGFSLGRSSTAEKPLISMSMKIPRIDFFKSGILIGVDGLQVGRVFIETCNKDSCEATVSVDAKMRQSLLAARSATFEYQVSKTESVSLLVNVEELPRALLELEDKIGLSSPAVAKVGSPEQNVMMYVVELRTNPYSTKSDTWGELLPPCDGVPAYKTVSVTNDLKILDDRQFTAWLDGVLRCSKKPVQKPVLWVTEGKDQHKAGRIDKEAGMYVIYDVLRDKKVPAEIVNAPDGVPTRFAE
jgi:invasion protein IalB